MDYGIDVSNWNRVDDWTQAHGNGLSAVNVLLSQGNYFTSAAAGGQVYGAETAGFHVGGYHFADPNLSVRTNVSAFLDQLTAHGLDAANSLAPMLDVEDSPGNGISWADPARANAFVSGWIRELRASTFESMPVIVYASESLWLNILKPDEWADDRVFLECAIYNGDPGNTGGFSHARLAAHQHTSEGYVPGVSGFVDRWCTVGSFTVSDMLIVPGAAAPVPVVPIPSPVPSAVSPGGWRDYRVQAGDSLSGIGAQFGASVEELANVNGIGNPDVIYAGQVIRVPVGGTTHDQYRIQTGDTLGGIAARYGVTVDALAAMNGITNPDFIRAGSFLDIPHSGAPVFTPAEEWVTAQSGDSLSAIAAAHGTTVEALVSLNGISNPDLIYIGQNIRVR